MSYQGSSAKVGDQAIYPVLEALIAFGKKHRNLIIGKQNKANVYVLLNLITKNLFQYYNAQEV